MGVPPDCGTRRHTESGCGGLRLAVPRPTGGPSLQGGDGHRRCGRPAARRSWGRYGSADAFGGAALEDAHDLCNVLNREPVAASGLGEGNASPAGLFLHPPLGATQSLGNIRSGVELRQVSDLLTHFHVSSWTHIGGSDAGPVRGANFCVTHVICVIQAADLRVWGDAGRWGCVIGDAVGASPMTQMTQGDADFGRLRHPLSAQVTRRFPGCGDAGDAAFPYLGKKGGCLWWCGAAQDRKKEPLRGTTCAGRRPPPNSKKSTPGRWCSSCLCERQGGR